MSLVKDATGKTFGRLLVLRQGASDPLGQATWECLCKCGATTTVRGASLRAGRTISCGCAKIDARERTFLKHGMARHGTLRAREYNIWKEIKRRCYNVKCKNFKNYGARGIIMCERWLSSFENFYADMGSCPPGRSSIDRKEVDGHYHPENCKWSYPKEQMNNTRRSRRITIGSENMTAMAASEKFGVGYSTLIARLNRGLSPEEAIYYGKF